jgi:uncharacterized membrane protein
MTSNRSHILDWSEQGLVPSERLRDAFELAGVMPGESDWRHFIDRMLLFIGVLLLGAGVIFFFAFNWQDLGRYAKFALVETPLLIALAFIWRLGVDSMAGKAALLLASLLTGALLALVGQTYQTGADTYELFTAWAVAILPWVLVARFSALWIVWILLVNLALAFYFLTFGILWGILFAPEKMLWLLFAWNTLALAVWEVLARRGVQWLRERWALRLLATAGGGLITALGLEDVLDWRNASHWGLPLWCVWVAAAYAVYRHRIKDVYVLAGGVLSVIVITTSTLIKAMQMRDAGTLLFLGIFVIGMSAAGGYWLKQVAAEEGV